jgi:hemerythrin
MTPPFTGMDEPAPFFEWRDEWTLEVGFMDEDHRLLAGRLNGLARQFGCREDREASAAGRATFRRTALREALDELGHATHDHFQREEEVMRTLAYPGFMAHKAEHDLLLAEYKVLVREIDDSARGCLDLETLESLKQWLMGHVLDMDRDLAAFLKHPAERDESDPG